MEYTGFLISCQKQSSCILSRHIHSSEWHSEQGRGSDSLEAAFGLRRFAPGSGSDDGPRLDFPGLHHVHDLLEHLIDGLLALFRKRGQARCKSFLQRPGHFSGHPMPCIGQGNNDLTSIRAVPAAFDQASSLHAVQDPRDGRLAEKYFLCQVPRGCGPGLKQLMQTNELRYGQMIASAELSAVLINGTNDPSKRAKDAFSISCRT